MSRAYTLPKPSPWWPFCPTAPAPEKWPVWKQAPSALYSGPAAFATGCLGLFVIPAPFNVVACVCASCGNAGGMVGFTVAGWVAYGVVQFAYARARLRHAPWLPVVVNGRPEVREIGEARWVHAYKPGTGLRRWLPAEAWSWEARRPAEAAPAGGGLLQGLRDRAAGMVGQGQAGANPVRAELDGIRLERARLGLERDRARMTQGGR